VIGVGQIGHRIAHHDQELFMLAHKLSAQRIVLSLDYSPFSDPLPELLLRRPVRLTVTTYDEGRLLLTFLRHYRLRSFGARTLRRSHAPFPATSPLERTHAKNPFGETSLARQQNCQTRTGRAPLIDIRTPHSSRVSSKRSANPLM
jgi:hypothetical protein